MSKIKQLTKEEAIAFYESEVWKGWTDEQISKFQIEQDLLCVPIDVFKKAVSNCIGRPIHTIELSKNFDSIKKEIYGENVKPPL